MKNSRSLLACLCLLSATVASAGSPLDGAGALWTPYLEWSFDNPTFAGNPFDLVATVTFTHVDSAIEHTTEMFYDGGSTWRVRFAGTRTGRWTAVSSSGDPELDGLTGTIEVTRGAARYGFLDQIDGAAGTRWGRQTGEGGAVQAFVPQFVMYHADPKAYEDDPTEIATTLATFFDEHGFNGFHVPHVAGRWFDIDGDEVVEAGNLDPDLRTLRALELLITTTHAAGGGVHLWAWGDQARRWTPTELDGGINGPEDRRLQRSIAARLGPIPGWTLGYGFDLDEWVDEGELHAWRDFMQARLGWFHYLGGRPEGPNSDTDHAPWSSWNEGMDYSSYEHHEPDYDVYVAALGEVADQPVFSEDRFRVRGFSGPGKDYTTEQTRRGLWHSAMAGGVANIWGNLTRPDGSEIGSGLSLPYPEPEWIQSYHRFIEEGVRFRDDFERAPGLSDGRALRSSTDRHYLFYVEDSASIEIDLSSMIGVQPAIAVDTTEPYTEIDLGLLAPTTQTLKLPAISDWAIAVGRFGPPRISVAGACPGGVSIRVEGMTPGGAVAVARSADLGTAAVPGGPCQGAELGLDAPSLLATFVTGPDGRRRIDRQLPAGVCSSWLVGVDLTTCHASAPQPVDRSRRGPRPDTQPDRRRK